MLYTVIGTLEELGFVRDEQKLAELRKMSLPQLISDFILPHCLCLPRSGVRYPRISGSFMRLMTKHGKDFLDADYELGGVLLECAMQRITCHPDLPAIDYEGILPEQYKRYSARSVNPVGINGCPDEPGLWGSAEVHFLLEMLPICLRLHDVRYANHAKTILFQLLTMLGKDARCGRISWLDDVRHCDVRAEKLWEAAVDMLYSSELMLEFIDYCVEKGWRSGMMVYRSWVFSTLDDDKLLSKIDLDKETYYTGAGRFFLKLFGLYKKKTIGKIIDEIRN